MNVFEERIKQKAEKRLEESKFIIAWTVFVFFVGFIVGCLAYTC